MDLEVTLFGLRIAVVALLYLFVAAVAVAGLGFLRRPAPSVAGAHQATIGRLVVLDPGDSGLTPGATLPLRPVTTIGRLPQSTVYLDDDTVSARHASLSLLDGRWVAEDLGSTNGSWLDGEALDRPAVLRPGAVLTVGRIRLSLEATA